MLGAAEITPDTRPFMLTIEEFARLCHVYNNICKEHPELLEYDYRTQENAALWRTNKLPLEV